MTIFSKAPPPMVRMQVLSAIDYAEGKTQRDRYKAVSQRTFVDQSSGRQYRFTWRTIETWVVRHKNTAWRYWIKKHVRIKIPNAKSPPLNWLRRSTKCCQACR